MRRKLKMILPLVMMLLILPACDESVSDSSQDESQLSLGDIFSDSSFQEDSTSSQSSGQLNGAESAPEEENTSKSTGEMVSGFDPATNQTITLGGITFSFPAYYDVLDEESTEQQRSYYPEPKNYYAGLIFSVEYVELSQSDFDSMKPEFADAMIDMLEESGSVAEIQSESTTIAGLSAWSISCISESLFISSPIRCSFVFNPESKAVVYIMHSHDSTDKSNYDYIGDYYKVLESAVLSEEQGSDTESGNQEMDENLKKLIALDREKNASDIEDFATVYSGQEIELELLTAYVEPYKNFRTRFNYLLYAVDGDNVMMAGPAFLFKDVNYYDLKLTGNNIPESFGTGIHCRVTAKVEGYEDGMILLDPISTKVINIY